jgi:hypothetical protein
MSEGIRNITNCRAHLAPRKVFAMIKTCAMLRYSRTTPSQVMDSTADLGSNTHIL